MRTGIASRAFAYMRRRVQHAFAMLTRRGITRLTSLCASASASASACACACVLLLLGTPGTTCSGKGTAQSDGSCVCWSPALGYGSTCSEFTNSVTCSGNGVVTNGGECVCTDPSVGEGPSCSEHTNGITCSGQGIAQPDGSCKCFSAALGVGPDCSDVITNVASCSGAGSASIKWAWEQELELAAVAAMEAAKAAELAVAAAQAVADEDQCAGILFGTACCASSCGECGGGGCSARPGGSSQCCTSSIIAAARLCDTYDPPCVIRSAWSVPGTDSDKIRLVDESTGLETYAASGRLELMYGGQWSTVCDDDFYSTAGEVACRQLGLGDYMNTYDASGGTDKIRYDDTDCTGHESSLLDCSFHNLGSSNCGHSEDIGLACTELHIEPCLDCLVGGRTDGSSLHFEICAPCSATVAFTYDQEDELFANTLAATCYNNKWTSTGWSNGNTQYTQKIVVSLAPAHSAAFPWGSRWLPQNEGAESYIITNELEAQSNGVLNCGELAAAYALSTSTTTTRTSSSTTGTSSTSTTALGQTQTQPNTTSTTTTTTTSLDFEIQCDCWDTATVFGPTCSELTAKEQCNDNGVLDPATQECVCSSQDIGLGDRCNVRMLSSSSMCNGKGVPNNNGTCDCFSGVLGTGPTCAEYTNAGTCNNQGEAKPDGSCECFDPAIGTGPTCIEYSNAATCGVKGRFGDEKGIATPDGGCFWLCDVYFGGYSRCENDDDDDSPTICGKCEGDCDTDSDCLPGLACMVRDEDDDYQTVTASFTNSMGERINEMVRISVQNSLPGCWAARRIQLAGNRRDEDFCYDPRDVVVHNHQTTYEEHCSQGAGKKKGPIRAAIVISLLAVVVLVWWFMVDCYPLIRDSYREKQRQKGLQRVFGRANPIICKALNGDAYPITDWAFVGDLVVELLAQNPRLVVETGMAVALVHPHFGKVNPKRGPWRDGMLASTIAVDNIALIFEEKAAATAPLGEPPVAGTAVDSDADYNAAMAYQTNEPDLNPDDAIALNPAAFQQALGGATDGAATFVDRLGELEVESVL